MTYKGLIKKSRTYDLIVVKQVVDTLAAGWLLYSPEQIGISVPIYFAVRMGLNVAAIIIRNKTTGPVGEK